MTIIIIYLIIVTSKKTGTHVSVKLSALFIALIF